MLIGAFIGSSLLSLSFVATNIPFLIGVVGAYVGQYLLQVCATKYKTYEMYIVTDLLPFFISILHPL